ncbi:MAG: hypothetical protein VXZ82_22565 [Planctomycetota bacterium]|nr:hypothetical protein [Planctomycetota bacterium]
MIANDEKPFEIDLYLLGDAAGTDFDSAAFEARMHEDVDLALQVADAIAEHQALRQALKSPFTEKTARDWSGAAIALLVTSAILLIAIWISTNNQDQPELATGNESISVVAENWIAFGESTDQQISAEHLSTESLENDYLVVDGMTLDLPAEPDDESEDWMLNAATDFYADLDR